MQYHTFACSVVDNSMLKYPRINSGIPVRDAFAARFGNSKCAVIKCQTLDITFKLNMYYCEININRPGEDNHAIQVRVGSAPIVYEHISHYDWRICDIYWIKRLSGFKITDNEMAWLILHIGQLI